MKTERLEIRLTKALLDEIDAMRGDVTRTRFIERAVEAALRPVVVPVPPKPVEVRGDVARELQQRHVAPTPLPKIAPRRWAK